MEFPVPLIFNGLIGVVCALIAHSRGRSAIGWGLLGLIFSCFAMVVLLVIPDLEQERSRYQNLARENQRLRELVRKDRQVADARHGELTRRLQTHDRALGLDTARRDSLLADVSPVRGQLTPPSPFATVDWYYVLDGEAKGPVRFADLRALGGAGVIHDRTLLWHDGLIEWTLLPEIPGLREEFHV